MIKHDEKSVRDFQFELIENFDVKCIYHHWILSIRMDVCNVHWLEMADNKRRTISRLEWVWQISQVEYATTPSPINNLVLFSFSNMLNNWTQKYHSFRTAAVVIQW